MNEPVFRAGRAWLKTSESEGVVRTTHAVCPVHLWKGKDKIFLIDAVLRLTRNEHKRDLLAVHLLAEMMAVALQTAAEAGTLNLERLEMLTKDNI